MSHAQNSKPVLLSVAHNENEDPVAARSPRKKLAVALSRSPRRTGARGDTQAEQRVDRPSCLSPYSKVSPVAARLAARSTRAPEPESYESFLEAEALALLNDNAKLRAHIEELEEDNQMLLDCAADLVEEELAEARWQRNLSLAALVGLVVVSIVYWSRGSSQAAE